MESNYSNRDFEQYVKQNADDYRMFPSEKVWKGVHSALHTRRKWSGLGLGLLLLLSGGAVTWMMTTNQVSEKQGPVAINNAQSGTDHAKEKATSNSSEIKNILPFNNRETVNEAAPILQEERKLNPAISLVTITDIEEDQVPLIISMPSGASKTENNSGTIINSINHQPVIEYSPDILIVTKDNHVGIKSTDLSSPKETLDATKQAVMPEPPQTIESITGSYKHAKLSKKTSWQVFVTPTVSYRRLSVNHDFESSGSLSYPFSTLTDVNKAVTHKPDLGLQIGLSAGFPVSKALKIRGGFQFNINRYDIKAFAYNGEVATINLNSAGGSSSVSTWTRYRNYDGYKSDWLQTFYFSLSVPVGLELKLFGNDKTSIGIAGTIQPTYVISDKAYLLSTDYKNYAKVPWLIRNVNMSTGFETFVNYSAGKTRWQIGPQVRYQFLSSFQNKYPVKENLFDFGLKVGLSLDK